MQPNAKTRIPAWLLLCAGAVANLSSGTASSRINGTCECGKGKKKTVGGDELRESKGEGTSHIHTRDGEGGERGGRTTQARNGRGNGGGQGQAHAPRAEGSRGAGDADQPAEGAACRCCKRLLLSRPPIPPAATAWLYLTQCPCPPGYGPATSGVSLPAFHEVRASVYVVCGPGCLSK